MTLYKWSQTAADNDDADSTINWRENQAPSTYNNSSRGMMAATAKLRDDLSGNLVTAGTSTAVTVTTNQSFASLVDGIFFYARITTTTGTDPTLAVDGLTAKQIRYKYGTNIPSGALLAGTVHKFSYDSTDDAWIVTGWFDGVLRTSDNPDLVAIEALAGTTGALKKTAANTWALDDGTFTFGFVIGDGISTITTGIKGDLTVPFACTITGVTLLGDTSGSIVIDLWKDVYNQFPPTDADSITASAPPTITSTTKSTDTTLTGWTTSVTAGDIIRFNVDSVTSFTRVTIAIKAKRFI